MLLLARKAGQSVVIDGNIRVTVDRIRGRVVRLRVEARTEIRVDREEVWNRRAGRISGKSWRPRKPVTDLAVQFIAASNLVRQRRWACDSRWRFFDGNHSTACSFPVCQF